MKNKSGVVEVDSKTVALALSVLASVADQKAGRA